MAEWNELVRQARRARRMTHAELAARSGVPVPTLKAYESGVRRASRQRLIDVLDALAPDRSARNDILAAAGYADRAAIARLAIGFYEKTGDAAKLAAAHEALLAVADTRGAKVERLEKLRALYAGPAADPAGAYRAALGLFEIDPSDAGNRDALVGLAQAANQTANLSDALRKASAATDDQTLRRDLLVMVAELEHDSSDPLAVTLRRLGCTRVVELDRGSHHPAFVFRPREAAPAPPAGDATVIHAFAQAMPPRTLSSLEAAADARPVQP